MTDRDKLTRLALRQARRRELPVRAAFAFACAIALMALCACLQNCAPVVRDDAKPLTQAQKKKNYDMLWGGHQEAHNARLP
jgi:hypothetical protein